MLNCLNAHPYIKTIAGAAAIGSLTGVAANWAAKELFTLYNTTVSMLNLKNYQLDKIDIDTYSTYIGRIIGLAASVLYIYNVHGCKSASSTVNSSELPTKPAVSPKQLSLIQMNTCSGSTNQLSSVDMETLRLTEKIKKFREEMTANPQNHRTFSQYLKDLGQIQEFVEQLERLLEAKLKEQK